MITRQLPGPVWPAPTTSESAALPFRTDDLVLYNEASAGIAEGSAYVEEWRPSIALGLPLRIGNGQPTYQATGMAGLPSIRLGSANNQGRHLINPRPELLLGESGITAITGAFLVQLANASEAWMTIASVSNPGGVSSDADVSFQLSVRNGELFIVSNSFSTGSRSQSLSGVIANGAPILLGFSLGPAGTLLYANATAYAKTAAPTPDNWTSKASQQLQIGASGAADDGMRGSIARAWIWRAQLSAGQWAAVHDYCADYL